MHNDRTCISQFSIYRFKKTETCAISGHKSSQRSSYISPSSAVGSSFLMDSLRPRVEGACRGVEAIEYFTDRIVR